MTEKTPHEKTKDVTRLVLAALGATPIEPTPEQVSLTGRTMMRESVLRQILPPMPVTDEDPFLKACQEIMPNPDHPVTIRSAFPPRESQPIFSMDFKSFEIDAQKQGLLPFSLYGPTLDKICRICRRSLSGTGYRNTDVGPVHVTCLDPKPAEPYVPPEIEG